MWDQVAFRRYLAIGLCIAGVALMGMAVYLALVAERFYHVPALSLSSLALIAAGVAIHARSVQRQVDRNVEWED